MKYGLVLFLTTLSIGCAHHQPEASHEDRSPSAKLWSHDSSDLRKGDLTVWVLQDMAKKGQFAELNNLFNNGVSMDSLPRGYAAGAGARVLNAPGPVGTALDGFTGTSWKGKYFFPKTARESTGLNRIRRSLLLRLEPIVLMANFTTRLVNSDPLTPNAKSNLVILNYADPVTKGYPTEILLKAVQVYDVMAAVPGRYGPIYIGKTWLGSYNSKTKEFTANDPNKLSAWFFLDFNKEALEEQARNHWDRSKEYYVDGTANRGGIF